MRNWLIITAAGAGMMVIVSAVLPILMAFTVAILFMIYLEETA